MIDREIIDRLMNKVREGIGLREAIRETGLPLRETLVELKKNYRHEYKIAKAEVQ